MKKTIIVIAAILIICFISQIYLPVDFNSGEIIFYIEKGENSGDIAFNLKNEGLIYSGFVFRLYVLITVVSKNLQAGAYSLSKTMNIPAIVKKFVSGDVARAEITFPEGFTSQQIYQKLTGITQININLSDLEEKQGYLFPDTYEIPYGAKSQEIVKMMTDNFNRKVTPDLRAEIKSQGKTLEEITTMASILEREVKTKEEKELVAGILWKRMNVGMRLQVDSAPETYEKNGLPENPICNPGIESITSAIYPKASPYWYYLSTPEGKTIFTKTLEEHNYAKSKYLK